ncbi:hypothetical protein ACFL35_04340 [Candidatus Riflebacteria bacterium]
MKLLLFIFFQLLFLREVRADLPPTGTPVEAKTLIENVEDFTDYYILGYPIGHTIIEKKAYILKNDTVLFHGWYKNNGLSLLAIKKSVIGKEDIHEIEPEGLWGDVKVKSPGNQKKDEKAPVLWINNPEKFPHALARRDVWFPVGRYYTEAKNPPRAEIHYYRVHKIKEKEILIWPHRIVSFYKNGSMKEKIYAEYKTWKKKMDEIRNKSEEERKKRNKKTSIFDLFF